MKTFKDIAPVSTKFVMAGITSLTLVAALMTSTAVIADDEKDTECLAEIASGATMNDTETTQTNEPMSDEKDDDHECDYEDDKDEDEDDDEEDDDEDEDDDDDDEYKEEQPTQG